MSMPAVSPKNDTITVAKSDLIAAWSLLERMVVSNRKIGSFFSHPVGEQQSPEQRRQMLEALFDYFGPEFFREISNVRTALDRYVEDEEGEAISDSLSYWEPKP